MEVLPACPMVNLVSYRSTENGGEHPMRLEGEIIAAVRLNQEVRHHNVVHQLRESVAGGWEEQHHEVNTAQDTTIAAIQNHFGTL